MTRPDFYLASTEGYDLEQPRCCWVERHLRVSSKPAVLVRTDPPVPISGAETAERVVLVARHVGESVDPISSWPLYVHVAQIVDRFEGVDVPIKALRNLAWAELYQTEEAARTKAM